MTLVLSQQLFVPGAEYGYGSSIKVFGPKLYLDKNLDKINYKNKSYQLMLYKIEKGQGVNNSTAFKGMKGPVNVYFKKYFYRVITSGSSPKKLYPTDLIIITTNDVNTYLHNQFELDHVLFDNLRFEIIR